MSVSSARLKKFIHSFLALSGCLTLFAATTSLSPWAEAAPKKNSRSSSRSNNGRGQEQGRGHCNNQGNGYGHLFGHHDDCCHEDSSDDQEHENEEDEEHDQDDDDLVDHDCDDHDSHEDDSEDEEEDEDEDTGGGGGGSTGDNGGGSTGDNGGGSTGDNGGGSTGDNGGGSTGDNGGGSTGDNGGGSTGGTRPPRIVKLPGKFDPSRLLPRTVAVTSGFDLSLGSIHLSPSKVTHITHGDVPNYGPADQFCPVNQVVSSTRLEFGRTRIVCSPIQDQALNSAFNEWAVGVEVASAEKIGSFSLLRGTLSVRALEIAGGKVQYSTSVQSGMNSIGSDHQALCPRNEVMVGVQTIDSKFPFKRFLTTQAQPYCAKVIASPKRTSKRARFEVPRDTSGQRRVIKPRL